MKTAIWGIAVGAWIANWYGGYRDNQTDKWIKKSMAEIDRQMEAGLSSEDFKRICLELDELEVQANHLFVNAILRIVVVLGIFALIVVGT